jgi:hypothetical protein
LVRARAAEAAPADLDGLRALLIACGQVEQAAHDALIPAAGGPATGDSEQDAGAQRIIAALHGATAHAADAFYSLAFRQSEPLPPPIVAAPSALASLVRCLEDVEKLPEGRVTVKLPEGFSFHALYPEQYAVAAGRWLADQHAAGAPLARPTLVVGIRSIGTTLAAVVTTVLRAAGVQVQSCTVRPLGHPFARRVDAGELAPWLDIPGDQPGPEGGPRRPQRALVVDEGPGISGSSMAAAAVALVAGGVPAEDIAFLPGHAGEPGGAGAEEVQAWWRNARRYVGEAEKLTFGGRRLLEALSAALTAALPAAPARRVVQMENISGGVWRQTAYADVAEWPPVCNAFERIKVRATLDDGSRVLLKFLGLAVGGTDFTSTAEAAAALLAARAVRQLAPPVVGVALGFVATRWIEGAPLAHPAPGQDSWQVGDAPTAVSQPETGTLAEMPRSGSAIGEGGASALAGQIDQLGSYIAQVVGPALGHDNFAAATERLVEMIYNNTKEALGEAAANRAAGRAASYATRCVTEIRGSDGQVFAAYGDGRMHPYEWICTVDGRMAKVDGVGHDCDHTLIGPQPVMWDLAGACVEWQLTAAATRRLLAAFHAAGGPPVDDDALHFYRLAYLAWRTGQCALAAEVHDPYEKQRLLAALAAYRRELAQLLAEP